VRRRSALIGMGVLPLAWVGARAEQQESSRYSRSLPSRKRKIEYIRQDIPRAETPPYQGTRYRDRVPDTIDIAENARLAIHALTALTDPDADYEMYFYLRILRNPPVLAHDHSDWCEPKFMEALPLLRLATGESLNNQVDRVWMDVILKSIGPDGLFYFPTGGRPWFIIDLPRWVPAIVEQGGMKSTQGNLSITQFAHPQPSGRILGTMTIYGERDRNSLWKPAIEKMIDRWAQLATHKDDYAYYPRSLFAPGAAAVPNAEMPVGMWGEETGGRLIQGLAQCYKVSGYEPARKLAGQLSAYMRYHAQYFDPEDGRFIVEPDRPRGTKYGGHFHAHTIQLLGFLEYATAAGDRDLMEYVRQSYEWAKHHPKSSDLVGFFPEWLDPYYTKVETCEIADMIALGLKLSQAGVGDYWDDVDRWARNQFVENQLLETNWVYEWAQKENSVPVAENESADHPAERNLGVFAGWAAVNDWVAGPSATGSVTQNCCLGNAARAIYYIWENILDYQDGTLRVNLLFNRASAWADVYSYIPYEGRVDLKVKHACRETSVRVPQWIETHTTEVTCKVNGRTRECHWEGRYVKLGHTAPGDTVMVSFPIGERTVKAKIGEVDYTLIVKGNTVVSVDPPGKLCPLYQRAHYRENQAR